MAETILPIEGMYHAPNDGCDRKRDPLPFGDKGAMSALPIKNAVQVPGCLCSIFQDARAMFALLLVLGLASTICRLSGGEAEEAIPYLALPAAPIFLYHSASGAKERFYLAYVSFKVGQVKEGLFFLAKGSDSAGDSASALSKSLLGATTLAGVASTASLAFIFTCIMPKLLLATTSLGFVAGAWAYFRNSRAVKEFNEKHSQGDLASILNFLHSPRLPPENGAADRAPLHALFAHTEHIMKHFTGRARHEEFKLDIDAILHQQEEHNNYLHEKFGAMNELQELFQDVLGKEQRGTIERMLNLYNHIAREMGDRLSDLGIQEEIGRKKEELNQLRQSSEELIGMAKSDMQRNLHYHLLMLFILVLILTGSSLYEAGIDDTLAATLLLMAGSSLTLGQILFDGLISKERYHKWRTFLGTTE